jgi:phospholipid/cholesterol/gamma-HCH transport system ATP-binding protein
MVEIKNISKSLGGHIVLDGLSLNIQDDEILSIIGQSGVGKTVLIKHLIGLYKPDSGEIIVDNENITGYSEHELNEKLRTKIGIVYQNDAVWDSLTVKENLSLGLKLRKQFPDDKIESLIKESMDLVELPDVLNEFPSELSGGMEKRVAIARAIVMKPKYLLYDEPTTGLDPVLTNIVSDLILKLNKDENITSLIISHDIRSIENISHRIGMIYKGKIIHICEADNLWKQENEIFNQFIYGDKNFK